MKQTVGFGIGGALSALLFAALIGDFSLPFGRSTGTLMFIGGTVATPTSHIVGVACCGLAVGGAVGGVLWLLGFRMVGPAGNRVARVTLAGLIGVGIGCGLGVAAAFGDLFSSAPEPVTILVIYAGCGLLAYFLALGAVAVTLRVSSDPAVRPTLVSTAVALIPGGVVATAAGIGTAWLQDFATVASTWIAVTIVVIVILAATFATARTVAITRSRTRPMPTAPRTGP